MKICVYAIRDTKAAAFGQPFFFPNVDVAIRALIQTSMDPDHQFNTNPEDFDFYALGTYDDQDGKFNLFDAPQHQYNIGVLRESFISKSTDVQLEDVSNG